MDGFYTPNRRKSMKSVKVFLLLMLALYIALFGLDYLKSHIFPITHHYHSLLIWIKTFVMVVAGVLIMKYTLEKKIFQTFIYIYLSLWAIYYIIKWATKFTEPTEAFFSSNKIMLLYLSVTQLLTPFPFFFFWILNRVFNTIPVKK